MGRFIDLLAAFAPDLPDLAHTATYQDAKSTIMRPIAADMPNLLVFPCIRSGHPSQFAHGN
jgi:hypothetical protein